MKIAMRYIFHFTFILCALWFAGCESDEADLTGASFDDAELMEVKSVRVFSHAGEVTNQQIVKRFAPDTLNLSANAISSFRYYVLDSVAIGKSSAVVKRYGLTFPFDLQRLPVMILTDHESHQVCCTRGETFTRSLPYFAGTIKPIVDYERIESSVRGNYVFSFTGKERILLNQHSNTLWIPCIQLAHHVQGQGVTRYFINNELDLSFSEMLQPGDTVSVIEMNFQLKRL